MRSSRLERGTTLVEAIVAIGLLAGAVVMLAGLSSVAVRGAALARERSLAAVLAVQKMEALCRDVRSAATSPGNALVTDSPGFIEYLDARGEVAAGRSGIVFVRRWSVVPVDADAGLLAVQVDVSHCRGAAESGRCWDATAHVRFASVRSRRAW